MASVVSPDHAPSLVDESPRWAERGRMYAIAFDMDTEMLEKIYHSSSWTNAYRDIRDELRRFGFSWQQGSVQFGGPTVTPVSCVLAVQSLAERYDWFSQCVRDIRMLRIEENNGLMPALERP